MLRALARPLRRLALPANAAALCAVFSGCTSGQVGTLPTVNSVDIASSAKLQLAVGTATIAVPGGGTVTGLNVVETFRQGSGSSATSTNTPTLTGPPGLQLNGSNVLTGATTLALTTFNNAVASGQALAQQPPAGLRPGDFGTIVGAFGYGLAPDNLASPTANQAFLASEGPPPCDGFILLNLSIANGAGGTFPFDSFRSDELAVPVYANPTDGLTCPGAGGGIANAAQRFAYYGGPPLWPSPQGYGLPNGFQGYPAGFTDFVTTPVAGQYSLNVAYPANSDGTSYASVTANATLTQAAAVLPPLPLPTLQIYSDGSGLVTGNVPPGVQEEIVFINVAHCNNSPGANHYAVLLSGTGSVTALLSSALGPPDASGKPTHTFCTVSDVAPGQSETYDIAAAGFDYPAFEASYPQSTSTTPTIAGANGQADVTTANPALQIVYMPSALPVPPASVKRHR